MASVRSKFLGVVILALSSLGCEGVRPVEPPLEGRDTGTSPRTVNAPSNLSAVSVSTSRIDLAWRDNSANESGFEVHRSVLNGPYSLRARLAVNASAYSDTGLTAGTFYCYEVRAFLTKGSNTYYSSFAGPSCVATQNPPPSPGPPSAPSAAAARPYGFGEVLVTWTNNGTNQDGFRVERSADSGSTWTTLATTGPTFEDIAPDPVDQPVCYRVIAFNSYGESAASNIACAVVLAAPTILTMVGDDLTWADNSSVESGYELWFMDVDGGPAYEGLAGTVPANTTSIPGLGPCLVSWCWGWVVMAVSSDGGRSWYAAVQTRSP